MTQHYDASYRPPFRIGSRVRLNPNFAALYPPRVRNKQDSGIVGAHARGDDGRSSNVHFNDGSEYEIRDEHLLAGWEEPPPAAQPPAAAEPAAEPAEARFVFRRKPSRRGGSSGSPMSPDACPFGLDPRACDERRRTPWGADPRFYRCTPECGKTGRFVERSVAATERAR